MLNLRSFDEEKESVVEVDAALRYSASGLLSSTMVRAVAVGTIVGTACVWTGGAACPTARGITLLTDCERLMLDDSYHNYTRMCLSTAAENGCWIADRTVTEPVTVLGLWIIPPATAEPYQT